MSAPSGSWRRRLVATVASLLLLARPADASIPLPATATASLPPCAAAGSSRSRPSPSSSRRRSASPSRRARARRAGRCSPADSTAIIVLDLSDSTTSYFTQIAGTLDSLTRESNRHLGLVVDSNTAYVALPPTTPVEGLRGWLHAFVRSPFLDYPWKGTFSQGTELSKGLVVAGAAMKQAHVRNPHVVLVTDLSDDTFDLQRLSAAVTQYQREHIDLRIVSLGENQSATAKLDTPNWHNAAYIARAASTVASPLSPDGVATHRPSLVAVAILLALVVLAATVLAALFHPLRWRIA